MSSGFISEAEIAAQKQKRQEEWEKVRQPNQPLEVEEAPYDSRSLYDKLKEQKDKKDYEYEEAHKLKNLIRGLDDDEVDFLHVVDKAKASAEHKQHLEETKELREYREQVASMHEKNMDIKLQAEIAKPKVTKLSTRPSQKSILSGMVLRKRPATDSPATSPSKSKPAAAASPSVAIVVADATTQSPPSDARATLANRTDEASPPANSPRIRQTTAGRPTALQCIGILPGVGPYSDSSCTEDSSDTDGDDDDDQSRDWLGKKRQCTDRQPEGHSH